MQKIETILDKKDGVIEYTVKFTDVDPNLVDEIIDTIIECDEAQNEEHIELPFDMDDDFEDMTYDELVEKLGEMSKEKMTQYNAIYDRDTTIMVMAEQIAHLRTMLEVYKQA